MKAFGFRLKQFEWAGRRFECIAKVRQSHEPDCMFDIPVATNAEGGPAGIGNPAVLLGEMALKEEVVNGTRKRDVYDAPEVNVANLRLAETILVRLEPMGMHGNPGPGDNFLSESFGTKGHRETSAVLELGDNSRCPMQACRSAGTGLSR
jgi:hypothetical protein